MILRKCSLSIRSSSASSSTLAAAAAGALDSCGCRLRRSPLRQASRSPSGSPPPPLSAGHGSRSRSRSSSRPRRSPLRIALAGGSLSPRGGGGSAGCASRDTAHAADIPLPAAAADGRARSVSRFRGGRAQPRAGLAEDAYRRAGGREAGRGGRRRTYAVCVAAPRFRLRSWVAALPGARTLLSRPHGGARLRLPAEAGVLPSRSRGAFTGCGSESADPTWLRPSGAHGSVRAAASPTAPRGSFRPLLLLHRGLLVSACGDLPCVFPTDCREEPAPRWACLGLQGSAALCLEHLQPSLTLGAQFKVR